MGSTYSDKASEQFRKYVISITDRARVSYLFWGTDLLDDENDKLLIDQDSYILAFDSISQLRRYLLNKPPMIFDPINVKRWAEIHSEDTPYSTFNLDVVRVLLDSLKVGHFRETQADILELINFYNLVGDYYYQTGDSSLEDLLQEENIKFFFDYGYQNFFWKQDEAPSGLIQDVKFDKDKFVSSFTALLIAFKKRIRVVEV